MSKSTTIVLKMKKNLKMLSERNFFGYNRIYFNEPKINFLLRFVSIDRFLFDYSSFSIIFSTGFEFVLNKTLACIKLMVYFINLTKAGLYFISRGIYLYSHSYVAR